MSGAKQAFREYLDSINAQLGTGQAADGSHRPALASLLQALAEGITATNEPKRSACGAPDYVVSKVKPFGPLTIGYVEAKDIGADLAAIERDSRKATPVTANGDQLRRYYPLGNVVLTDYLCFRWYIDGKLRAAAELARVGKDRRVVLSAGGEAAAQELLLAFLEREPTEIDRPKDLAERMARLTHMVRDIVITAFKNGEESDLLSGLHAAFKTELIPELKTDEFADMFAQTLAYGLFAARCNHSGPSPFRRTGAAAEIPKTNPFLRKLFDVVTGLQLEDEPFAGFVDDIVQLLAHTNIDAVLADFGKRTKTEDPVVHFYETFLAAYDPQLRDTRGVYYTPEPVVSYIVESVDYLLRDRFGCDGLGDAGTVDYLREEGEGTARKLVKAQSPRVLILDPACGTGSFLYSVIDHIREQFMQRKDAGMWNGYVQEYLLPRLFGFELLMAPYAVAHLKLGMQLAGQDLPPAARDRWGCRPDSLSRLGVYLTNSLEEAERKAQVELLLARFITEEAQGAGEVKRQLPIMVVLGNPPYSGNSANRSYREAPLGPDGQYIAKWKVGGDGRAAPVMRTRLLTRKGRDTVRQPTFIGRLLMDYYISDGQLLSEQGERNPKWLQDDYVKFLRFGQWRIEQTGQGILAFVTNHGYLDNPTFRGMRQQLMDAFTDIYILDLHGNSKKKERCPDGSKDENVFDIQQGVAIGIFVKDPGKKGPAKVQHAELWGVRETTDKPGGKYPWLFAHDVASTEWRELAPVSPFYLFAPRETDVLREYERGWKVTDAMPVNSVGIVTSRDDFVFDFDEASLKARITDFLNPRNTDDVVRQRYFGKRTPRDATYSAGDKKNWRMSAKRAAIQAEAGWRQAVTRACYRPFDDRAIFYHPEIIERSRSEVMRHMLAGNNVALCVGRAGQVVGPGQWDIIYCSKLIEDLNLFYRGGNVNLPLYLCPNPHTNGDLFSNGLARYANLSPALIADIEKLLGLEFLPDGNGALTTTFGPEDVFNYMYAVLHSPTYRRRYAESLKIDFPRIPLTSDLKLFRRLAAIGAELVSLHLLESPALANPPVSYPEPGDDVVDAGCPRYLAPHEADPATGKPMGKGRVYINRGDPAHGKPGQYFDGVSPEIWQFHIGGYRVCEKWLKDRRGRSLTFDDRVHYQKIIFALGETIHLMAAVDAAIPAWPIS